MRKCTTSLALLAGMGLALSAQAGEAPQQQDDTVVYFNGIKVAIDPATGKIRQPNAQELAALRMSVKQAPVTNNGKPMPKTRAEANRTVRKQADGSLIASVSEDMMSTVVAVRQPDGSIRIQHEGDVQQEAASE